MKLKDLLPNCDLEIEASGIEIDSRLVKSGSVFFALQGKTTDGTKFINQAFENGAIVAVCNKNWIATPTSSARNDGAGNNRHYEEQQSCDAAIQKTIIKVDDVHQTLVLALQKFYPNLPENILAITGTNGKTSVAHFISQLQEILGRKSASIGTLGIIFNNKPPSLCFAKASQELAPPKQGEHVPQKLQLVNFGLTTPDIVSLYKNLSILKQHGINDVAIEASSIGLEQRRLAGLKIGLGAFTNFTQDHLDYHGTMEEYFNCKMLLFKEVVCDSGIAVLNADIPEFEKIKEVAAMRGLRIFEYGFCQPASNHQLINAVEENGLAGDFQKANLLCALTAVIAYYQLDKKQTQLLLDNLNKIQPAEGRMQLAATLKNNAKIFIDFAHTPDALQNILSTAKKLPHNRLIVLFGCGGDRDKSKRPQMGKIASNLADLVIVSDDNPRCENPAEIRKEILSACDLTKTTEVENRQEAIKQAIAMLEENDILILAGKGHEKYQIIGEEKLPFDEEKIVQELTLTK